MRIGIIGNIGTVSHFERLCIQNIGFPVVLEGLDCKIIANA